MEERSFSYRAIAPNSDAGRFNRILIVDDEQFNIDALKIILRYHCNIDSESVCDSAFDGKQALDAVKNNVDKN